jgi:hypothetical protein
MLYQTRTPNKLTRAPTRHLNRGPSAVRTVPTPYIGDYIPQHDQ